MRQVVSLGHVDRDDAPLPHQIEQLREKEDESSLVRPRLDEEIGLHLPDRLLDDPQIEHRLTESLAEPGDIRPIPRVSRRLHEEDPLDRRKDLRAAQPPLAEPPQHALLDGFVRHRYDISTSPPRPSASRRSHRGACRLAHLSRLVAHPEPSDGHAGAAENRAPDASR
jgi:hypothetical protein